MGTMVYSLLWVMQVLYHQQQYIHIKFVRNPKDDGLSEQWT